MTGIVARTISTKVGVWTAVYDSGTPDQVWQKAAWNSSEPEGTAVTVKVRSSNDQVNWSAWETVQNNVAMTTTPKGRYLQTEVKLQILSGEVSPIFNDLTITFGGGTCTQPPVLTWLPVLSAAVPAEINAGDILPIKFSWTKCGNPLLDESVSIRVRDANTSKLISGFVYKSDISYDETTGEYLQNFNSALYSAIKPGTRLKVMVYFGGKLQGTALVNVK